MHKTGEDEKGGGGGGGREEGGRTAAQRRQTDARARQALEEGAWLLS